MEVKELKIKKVNFFPVVEKDAKGFLGFISVCLGSEEKDFLILNSIGVYTVLNNSNHKIRLTKPAKKVGAGLKFYFKIDPELEEEIVKAVEKEVGKLYDSPITTYDDSNLTYDEM